MQIFHYDRVTGEFRGEATARIDPLDPERSLIPANATTVAPPSVPSGHVAVFDGEAWASVEDLRGAVYYDPEGERHEVETLGFEIPASWSETPPPPPVPVFTEEDVRREGAVRLDGLVSGYTRAERETWKGQLAGARVVLDGGTSALIDALAAARGITAAAMAQVILDKETALMAAIGPVLAAQETLLNADPIPDPSDPVHWPA